MPAQLLDHCNGEVQAWTMASVAAALLCAWHLGVEALFASLSQRVQV